LVSSYYFEIFIYLVVISASIRLILETFFINHPAFNYVDALLNLIFLIEVLIKIIAFGFLGNNSTYLRDNWNKFDFLITIIGMFDFSNFTTLSNQSSMFEFMKIFKILRPLRVISKNRHLKKIMTALFDNIMQISSIVLVIITFFVIFSSLGMGLFYPLYHNCYEINNEIDILPYYQPVQNFSQILKAEYSIDLYKNNKNESELVSNVVSRLILY